MTSYMQIMVRVISNRAQAQMEALRRTQNGLTADITRANAQTPLGQRHVLALSKFGNQLQWTGRMIQYNFTLPIAAAIGMSTKWALEQDKAMTHVAKVYGDTAEAAKFYVQQSNGAMSASQAEAKAHRVLEAELRALDDAFTAISNHYGVQKKEVLEVAGAWAAAGASGRDLAESVNQTMKAIIIGDIDAAKATESLIAIQAQYNLSTQELNATLANLNAIENATGISMAGLIDGFSRAAGVARSAGIETRELGAMLAALVPATGSATNAGNALKTIISRLMAPTKEAKQVMNAMGLETTAMAWQSATASERLQIMAKEFSGMGQAAKNAASSVIASRWQINRFDVLMREMVNTHGYYQRALDATANQSEAFARMQRELNTVLESDPRRLQRMWVMLQNASADIIQPLIPYIIYLAQEVAQLAQAFSQLDPQIQKIVLWGLVLLALVGPIVKYIGAFTTLVMVLYRGVTLLAGAFGLLGTAIGLVLSPFRMLGTLFTGAIGGLVSIAGTGLTAVGSAFAAGFASITTITLTFWRIQAGIWKAALATKLLMVRTFWMKLQLLWVAASLGTVTRWAAMWTMLKGLTVAGFVAIQARFIAFSATLKIWTTVTGAMVLAWRTTWGLISAINLAGIALIRAQWIAMSVMGIGIFSKLRAALVTIWITLSAATATIWRGMAMTVLAFSKLMLATVAMTGKNMIALVVRFGKFFVSWPAVIIAAIVGVLYAFRDQIGSVLRNALDYFGKAGVSIGSIFAGIRDSIISAFNSLPQSVQNAMVAVVTVIREAALAVYEWFSYINPFARHSPSLVDNVTAGMESVLSQFGRLKGIGPILKSAYGELARFGKLSRKLNLSADAMENRENRKVIRKSGNAQIIASYNRLLGVLKKLEPALKKIERRIAAQERVVEQWQAALDRVNRVIDRQEKKLDKLQDAVNQYQDLLSQAESRLDMYANAPLKGMQAMEDQIFANRMEQVRLRYEMMQLEDVFGTYDELRSKIEAINGAQEILRGTQADLRQAGAGSEILSVYDQEIAKLDQQKDKYEETANTLYEMQTALEKLQREAERLDLIKAMKFDELQYEIDKAANQMEELSFEEIMAGIQGAQRDIQKYTGLLDGATAAVEAQEAVLEDLYTRREQIQEQLDKEQAKLERMQDQYNKINDAIQAIRQSMSDVVSDAEALVRALDEAKKAKEEASGYISPGLQNFLDAGDAGFPDPGGMGIPPRDDWSSQVPDIEDFTREMAESTSRIFEDLNPFAGFKAKAAEVWNHIKGTAKDAAGDIVGVFGGIFDNIGGGGGDKFSAIFDSLKGAGEFVTEVVRDIAKVIKWGWELFGPDLKQIAKAIRDSLVKIWDEVGPELAKFKDLIKPLGKAIKNVWKVMKPILAVIAAGVLGMAQVILDVVAETIGPAFDMFIDIIKGAVKIIRGLIKIIVGILTLDFGMVWGGVVDIVSGAWDAITGIFSGAVGIIWGVVKGIVTGIYDFFVWLYDKLVGHSIVPDLVNGIIDVFRTLVNLARWIWDNVLKPIYDFFVELAKLVIAGLKTWWSMITKAWDTLTTLAKWVWKNILDPVYDNFKKLWDDYVKPALSLWWDGIKNIWNALKQVGKWLWDNVLKPVYDRVKGLWDNYVKPAFHAWWDGIKTVWNALKNLGGWVWDNVLKPVFNRVKDLWGNVKDELNDWLGRIKNVWNGLKSLGGWVKNNVMDPVVDAFKNGWKAIRDWMNGAKDILTKPVKGIVNVVIDAVNLLIKGLNKIADVLPGFDWHINTITKLESGGQVPTMAPALASGGTPLRRRVGGGFKTNGARAIVGEGKANWPEYVIPTDPTYRNRAKSLLAQAASKIGVGGLSVNPRNAGGDSPKDAHRLIAAGYAEYGLPQFGIGGIIDDITGAIDSGWEGVKDLGDSLADYLDKHGKEAVSYILKPFKNEALGLMDRADWDFARGLGKATINGLWDWALAADQATWKKAEKKLNDYMGGKAMQAGLNFAYSQVGKPYVWGGVGPGGYDCSGFMSAITNVIRGGSPYSRVGTTATFPWPGFSSAHSQFMIGSTNNYGGSGVGHMAGTLMGINVESAGGIGVRVGGSARGYLDGGFRTRAGLVPRAANGALVRASRRGSLLWTGEGGNDEAVVPLPKGWRANASALYGANSGGDDVTEIHIHGNLEFPNIKNGEDAETFIENLKSLAGGAA